METLRPVLIATLLAISCASADTVTVTGATYGTFPGPYSVGVDLQVDILPDGSPYWWGPSQLSDHRQWNGFTDIYLPTLPQGSTFNFATVSFADATPDAVSPGWITVNTSTTLDYVRVSSYDFAGCDNSLAGLTVQIAPCAGSDFLQVDLGGSGAIWISDMATASLSPGRYEFYQYLFPPEIDYTLTVDYTAALADPPSQPSTPSVPEPRMFWPLGLLLPLALRKRMLCQFDEILLLAGTVSNRGLWGGMRRPPTGPGAAGENGHGFHGSFPAVVKPSRGEAAD